MKTCDLTLSGDDLLAVAEEVIEIMEEESRVKLLIKFMMRRMVHIAGGKD